MRHRVSVNCETCDQNLILRIAIGHEKKQQHVITCPKCSEEITISLDLSKPPQVKIDELLNAIRAPETSDGIIMNLSPSLPISNDMLNKDFVAPDMLEMMKILEENGTMEKLKKIPNPQMVDMTLATGKKDNILTQWKSVKKCWSLYKNDKEVLLERFIPNNDDFKNPTKKNKKDFKFQLFDFLGNFIDNNAFSDIMDYSQEAKKKNQDEYLKFLEFIAKDFCKDCIKDFYSIFLKFFDNYSEFSQVEIHALNNMETKENYDVTSFDFYKTDMFYGEAYEKFTKYMDVLALLFNIHEGRSFNQFLEMDYERYKTLDKANKPNPIKNVIKLYSICDVLYSGLRNASHHGDIRFDANTHTIEYTHGKDKKQTDTMTYGDYLRNCYDIFISCCTLINVIILHIYDYECNKYKNTKI